MLSQDQIHSVDHRLHIAKCLVRSVMAVHTARMVHKNIRPETILVFPRKDEDASAYLVGFERFRAAAGATTLAGDSTWQSNLYRHPERQGQWPESEYIMQHDIYSLGVCLLEIGLWRSFVQFAPEQPEVATSHTSLDLHDLLDSKTKKLRARPLKKRLSDMSDQLPSYMGNCYSQIVKSCLQCLDREDRNTFSEGVDFDDDERGSVLVGLQYIEKILVQIDGIRMSGNAS